ncbi:hypothetical protein JW948_18875 [bacterium]|nr:hypothetical protein [bacterium]
MKKLLKNCFRISEYSLHEDDRRQMTLRRMMFIIPVAYVIFILTRIHAGDPVAVQILVVSFVMITAAFLLGLYKNLKTALFFMSLIMLASVTIIVTVGQGIHDVAIVAYPAILLMSSLLLDSGYFIALTVFSLISLAWTVFGDAARIYHPLPHGRGSTADFYVVGTILLISAVFSYMLAHNFRQSISKARKEIDERLKAEEALQKSLADKSALLQEIHHRVKNNLTIISSLLSLQESRIHEKEDIKSSFEDIRNRIMAMSLVHEQLYNSETLSHIDMPQYIDRLMQKLVSAFDSQHRIQVEMNIDPVVLNIETAIPCGIIINEIITNAYKHAFGDYVQGEIKLQLRKNEDMYLLNICDNGPGLPQDIDMNKTDSLGLSLISLLTKQLGGHVVVENRGGCCITLEFPYSPVE